MATAEQIAELRRKVSEPDTTTYSDTQLNAIIDENASVDAAASVIWEEKSSMYAELVDISEAGSSRKNSQLAANAREQARYYSSKAGAGTLVAGVDYPTTTRIVRP